MESPSDFAHVSKYSSHLFGLYSVTLGPLSGETSDELLLVLNANRDLTYLKVLKADRKHPIRKACQYTFFLSFPSP
jgi:hypothetical protein